MSRLPAACVILTIILGSGCSSESVAFSSGAVDTAHTNSGDATGDSFRLATVDFGCCGISFESCVEYEQVRNGAGDRLDRVNMLVGYWLVVPFVYVKTLVGGTGEHAGSGDWGLGPAAEAAFGLYCPVGDDMILTADVYAAGQACLGSVDDSFGASLSGSVGWRLGIGGFF